jgi:hypothetical protein
VAVAELQPQQQAVVAVVVAGSGPCFQTGRQQWGFE